jgi:hypothetical protein
VTTRPSDELQFRRQRNRVHGIYIDRRRRRSFWDRRRLTLPYTRTRRIEERIKPPRLHYGRARSRKRKHIRVGGNHRIRPRSRELNPIRKIQPFSNKVWNRLLAILRPDRSQQRIERRRVARYTDRRYARIDRRKRRRDRPAARAPKGSNPLRIHLRPFAQIIHGTHRVPHKVSNYRIADQRWLQPRFAMLTRRPRSQRRIRTRRVWILQPFALPNRIIRKHHKPVPRKRRRSRIVPSLAQRRMPWRHHNRRQLLLLGPAIRNIQQRRHMKPRLAIE